MIPTNENHIKQRGIQKHSKVLKTQAQNTDTTKYQKQILPYPNIQNNSLIFVTCICVLCVIQVFTGVEIYNNLATLNRIEELIAL